LVVCDPILFAWFDPARIWKPSASIWRLLIKKGNRPTRGSRSFHSGHHIEVCVDYTVLFVTGANRLTPKNEVVPGRLLHSEGKIRGQVGVGTFITALRGSI